MAHSFGTVPTFLNYHLLAIFDDDNSIRVRKFVNKKSNLLQLWRQPCAFFGGTHGRWDQTTLPNPKQQIPTTETQTSLECEGVDCIIAILPKTIDPIDARLWWSYQTISSNFNFLCRTPQWWFFSGHSCGQPNQWSQLAANMANSAWHLGDLWLGLLVEWCRLLNTPNANDMTFQAWNTLHTTIFRIALSNSISQLNESQEQREDVESFFFLKMLLVWVCFKRNIMAQMGPKLLALLALDWQLISLGMATHFCRHLPGLPSSSGHRCVQGCSRFLDPNLDTCCYAAWQAALFFLRRNDSEWSLSFFNEVRTEIKKKNTCLQKIHPLLHPVGLPNQLENLKWKLLNSKEPTFLPNHPPRNNHVSQLGKSKI